MKLAPSSPPPGGSPATGAGGMQARLLRGYSILIVEDEYFLADDLAQRFEGTGAIVLGPVGTVRDSIEHISRSDAISVAVLDIRLGRELVFPVADALADRLVPFVFYSAYDELSLPERFRDIRRVSKVAGLDEIVRAILAERAIAEATALLGPDEADLAGGTALLPPLRLMARLLTGDQARADDLVALALERAISAPASLSRHPSRLRWLAGLVEEAWAESLRQRLH